VLGGLVAAVPVGIAAYPREEEGAANSGRAAAGIVCSVLAPVADVVFAMCSGTFAARDTTVVTTFSSCTPRTAIAAPSPAASRLANDSRPCDHPGLARRPPALPVTQITPVRHGSGSPRQACQSRTDWAAMAPVARLGDYLPLRRARRAGRVRGDAVCYRIFAL